MIVRFETILVILVLIKYGECVPRLDPLVETEKGLIRGLRASDGDYSMFLGIPYAVVDDDNPFGPCVPHPGFTETFNAYNDTAICPQIEDSTILGSLDCLHLNIYVPDTASSKNLLPVLTWIYGGGFSGGYAGRHLFGPKYLVRHDVILITLNYRVGPYGFMCLDIPEVSGNQGLKDQLTALRWIKNNIESFGGDPNKITIFGESAGGISVDVHLMSEQESLFRSVISQSGTGLIAYIFDEPNNQAPLQLASQLGFETEDLKQALNFLAKSDPKLVVAASQNIERFKLCVEKSFDGVEKIIPDYTVNREIPKAKNMPILLGFNSDEGLSFIGTEFDDYFENVDIIEERLKLYFDFDDERLAEMKEIVQHFYIGDNKPSKSEITSLANVVSDLSYAHPVERTIKRYLDNDAGNIFFYVFSYNGSRNLSKNKGNITYGGAQHADEIGYLFDVSYWTEEPSTEDQKVIDRMTEMWANFAKYGNPTPETTDLLLVNWEPVKKGSSLYYLNIDQEPNLSTRPYKERMAFWDLFYEHNWKFQRGYRGESE